MQRVCGPHFKKTLICWLGFFASNGFELQLSEVNREFMESSWGANGTNNDWRNQEGFSEEVTFKLR